MTRSSVIPWAILALFVCAAISYLAYGNATLIVVISVTCLFYAFLKDRTIAFIFPSIMILTILFICPLFISGTQIAIKDFVGSSTYDKPLFFAVILLSIAVCAQSIYQPRLAISRRDFLDKFPKNDILSYLFAIIILILALLSLEKGTLFQGNYREITEERYSFIEYSTAVMVVGVAAARSRNARRIMVIAMLFYLTTCILTGLRLRFIAGAVVLFACVGHEEIQLRHKIAGVTAILTLFILGWIRSADFSPDNISISEFLQSFEKRDAVVSTFGGGFQSAKWYIYFVQVHAKETFSGLWFFIGDLIGAVVSRNAIPPSMNVKALLVQAYSTPGGGLFVGYFYAYFGMVGVVVACAVLAGLLIGLKRSRRPIVWPYVVICCAYGPRLLLYDYTVMFKMCFATFILMTVASWLGARWRMPTPRTRGDRPHRPGKALGISR